MKITTGTLVLNGATLLAASLLFLSPSRGLSVTFPSSANASTVAISKTATSPAVDPSFSAQLSPDLRGAEVAAVAADGTIVVNILVPYPPPSGTSEVQVVRLLADGRRDPSFNSPFRTSQVLASFSDRRLLTAQAPYRLNSDGSAAPIALPSGLDPAKPLGAALVLPDGKFLIAQEKQLVRLNSDGSLDPTFSFGNSNNAVVRGLKADAQNRVLVAINYESDSESIQTVIRLLPSGMEDTSFHILSGGYRTAVGISPLASGDYLEYSNFEGGQRLAFTLRTSDALSQSKWSIEPNSLGIGIPEFITVDPVGRVYVADLASHLRRLLITDAGLISDPTFALTVASSLSGVYIQPDGRLLVAGDFTSWDGHPTQRIARLTEAAPYLANLSGRAATGVGEDTVIAGLVTDFAADFNGGLGTLIRGAGPVLEHFGVQNFLSNPVVEVYDHDGQMIASNGQWDESLTAVTQSVGAFAFTPHSNDAAMLEKFPSTRATIFLRNKVFGGGVGLLEIYRVSGDDPSSAFINLSFRAHTAPGEATAVAGFVIVDPQRAGRRARVLLRAVGPTLSTLGIVHPLADPVLTVYNSKGEIVAQNDDWSIANLSADVATLEAGMSHVGAFPLPAHSKDSALLLELPAGAYSMHATGGTGVVLLEIYLVR